jgi:hypothetical protein
VTRRKNGLLPLTACEWKVKSFAAEISVSSPQEEIQHALILLWEVRSRDYKTLSPLKTALHRFYRKPQKSKNRLVFGTKFNFWSLGKNRVIFSGLLIGFQPVFYSNFKFWMKAVNWLVFPVYRSIFRFLFFNFLKFWIVPDCFFMNRRNWIGPVLSVFMITERFSSIFESERFFLIHMPV